MSNTAKTIFNDLMENVKIIYDGDNFAYAKTDDIKSYLDKILNKFDNKS